MLKNFDVWNDIKKELDVANRDLFFKEGEIWWCSVGLNIAVESCGKGETFRRPVLVLKKLANYSFIGIPLSTQIKSGTWFTDVVIDNKKQCILLYQIRMFSKNRLQRRFATLSMDDFQKVKEKLEALLELSHNHQSADPGSVGNPKSTLSINDDENKSIVCYTFPMNHLISIRKADGSTELFEESKLVESLKNAGGGDQIIDEVIDHIGKEIKDGMTTGEIYSRAFKLLHAHSMPMAVKYSLRRALSELGPDGFPFEKYIAKLFEAWGYQTLTDQTVMGSCVSHEMDVVAWNEKKLVMVEAKFHNEFGLKSDVKVALYIKARFDDIKANMFDYGGIKRTISEGWLVTNTKFTDQAIHYGECNHVKMLGWNYPAKGNLQDIIEELHLHPFTCLISLSNSHKKDLLAKGLVLCAEIAQNPAVLTEIGMKEDESKKVLEEISTVMYG